MNSPNQIIRSFYINNTLYTVSNAILKANNLDDLSDLGSIML